MKSSALVSDGVHRKSLSVTRALDKQGIQVSVVSDEFFAPSFWSKYCKKKFHLDLLANKDKLNFDFFELIRGDNSNVVFFLWKTPQLSGFQIIDATCLHISIF